MYSGYNDQLWMKLQPELVQNIHFASKIQNLHQEIQIFVKYLFN